MGLLACFGGNPSPVTAQPAAPPQPTKVTDAVREAPHQEQPAESASAIRVLHVNGQSASLSGAALSFGRNEVPTGRLGSEDIPRIVCHLHSKSPPCASLHLPIPPCLPAPSPHPWLYAQPVAANDAAWSAMGTQDLQLLTQALGELLGAANLQSMSAVALSVAAPSGMQQPAPFVTSNTSRCTGGGSVKVSSSYIRDPEDCTLSPALVLELQGTRLAPEPTAAMQQPAALQLSDPGQQRAPRKAEIPPAACPAVPGIRRPLHEEAAKQLSERWKGDAAAQDELLRARSMLSAIPCVATLLELVPHMPWTDGGGGCAEAGLHTCELRLGRVLLQNEASLTYWGKLDGGEEAGARHMLAALFKEEPQDAIQELLRHVAEQQDVLGSASGQLNCSWSRVVQVYTPRPLSQQDRPSTERGSAAGPGAASHTPGMEAAAAGSAGAGPSSVAGTLSRGGSRQPSLPSPASQPLLPLGGSQPFSSLPSSRRKLCLLGEAAELREEPSSCSITKALEALIPEESCSGSHSSDGDDTDVDHYGCGTTVPPRTGDVHCPSSCGPGSLQKMSSPFRPCSQALPIDPPPDRVSLRHLNHSSSQSHRTSLTFPQMFPGETVTPSVSNRVMMLSLLTAPGSGPGSGVSSAADVRPRSQVELHLKALGSLPLPGTEPGRRFASMSCVDTVPLGAKVKRGQAVTSSITPAWQHSGGLTLPSRMSGPKDAGSSQPLEDAATKQRLSLPSSVESPSPSAPLMEIGNGRGAALPRHSSGAAVTLVDSAAPSGPEPLNSAPDPTAGEVPKARPHKVSWELCKVEQQHTSGANAGGGGVSTSSRHSDLLRSMGMEDLQAALEEDARAEDCSALTHEVQALVVVDPVSGNPALLILQTDITARALMEKRMSALTETQLTMLENMLPRQVLEYAIRGAGPIGSMAFQHQQVTILFMDIVGFTSMSKEVQPHLVMEYLNRLFSRLDELCEAFGVYKVDTAGDCYIVAGALMTVDEAGFIALDEEADPQLGAKNVVGFAEEIMHLMQTVPLPHDGRPTSVRIGIHTGSVVSGVVGTKMFKFSLFGDTMNTSSRMESTSKPGCIQVSEATYNILEDDQQSLFKPTGGVEVKGKGLMATYIYIPGESESSDRSLGAIHGGGNLEQRWRASVQGLSMSAASSGASNTASAFVGPSAESKMQLPQSPRVKCPRRARRFSMESDCPGPKPITSATLFSSPQSSRARTRRSYCAAYVEGTARRSDHMFADVFLAATAAMVTQPRQQQDGARLKLLKSNVKLLKQQ